MDSRKARQTNEISHHIVWLGEKMESSISNISRREPSLALGIAHILGRVVAAEWEKSINAVKYNALIGISPKNTQPTNQNLTFGSAQKRWM